MRILLSILTFLTLTATTAQAERDAARVYAFGNSLVHHLSESDETTVPHWMALMALSERKDFRLSGEWGFLRDFARLPPEPNWSFGKVREAWNSGRFPFDRAKLDTVWITPANFIQGETPATPYPDDNPQGISPLSATLDVIDWVTQKSPGVRVMVYEGWPDMGPYARRFPPRPRNLRKYYAYGADEYAEWYRDFVRQIQSERPRADVTLIPVSSALMAWLTGPLDSLPAETLYLDSAPHGTQNLYFLAALVSYAAVFDAAPPAGFRPPESIHPRIREAYPQLAQEALDFVREAGAELGPVDGMSISSNAPASATPAAPEEGGNTGETSTTEPAETEPEAQEPAPRPATPEVREDAAARPAGGLEDPSLAMGLNGIADWSSQQPFVDVFKTARPWTGHLPGRWGGVEAAELEAEGHLDAQGWPLRVPERATKLETFVMTDMPPEASDLAGRYVMRWKGDGDIRLGGRISNAQYSYSRREATFDYTPGDGSVSISLSKTDPENRLRDISIVKLEHAELHAMGVLFNPDWIARIEDLRMIRFMDWMFTNGSEKRRWDDRARREDYTWVRRGVPVEVMIELANTIGADPWFNMPHMADDDYVARFATRVRDRLDPRLAAHVEYSNELWNFVFPQTAWARDQAVTRWGEADDDRWMQFAGGRAAEVAQIWSAVFEGLPRSRLINVIAVHTGWPGLEEAQLEAQLWREEVEGRKPPVAYFDAYAVAGYFGYELGEEENVEQMRGWLETSRIVAEAAAAKLPTNERAEAIARTRHDIALQLAAAAVAQGSLAELTGTLWPYHAEVARKHELALLMYEGGSHVTGVGALVDDTASADFFARFNYAPEMAALYEALLREWRNAGGQSFNAFVDVAVPTKWGSWGALRHLSDENPRWDILMAANAKAPHWDRTRAPGTFVHGLRLNGTQAGETLQGTGEEDVITAGAGDDVIRTEGGADHIHGGPGRDVAVLPGQRSDYQVERDGDLLRLTREGKETRLLEVERLIFDDGKEIAASGL